MKHITCELSKQQIIEILAREFDKAHEAAERDHSEKNVWREEALRDLLKIIPIYEHY